MTKEYKIVIDGERYLFFWNVIRRAVEEYGVDVMVGGDPNFYKFQAADPEIKKKILAGEMTVDDI